jgi:hypothetical protein
VECKLRCVNFRTVSDGGRVVRPALGVTEISDDWYRSTMRVIVISLGIPRSAGESFRYTWEHVGAPATRLGVPATRLRKPSLGMLQVGLEIIATTYRSTIVKTHVFRLYSHLCIYVSMYLCIYIATYLHTIYLDWLQAMLESNSRCG